MTTVPPGLSDAWTGVLAGSSSSSSPMPAAELRRLVARLTALVADTPADPDAARETGAAVAHALVEAHHTEPAALAGTLTVLDEHLSGHVTQRTLSALRAGLAGGFAQALCERTHGEQELIRQAVLTRHRADEARFRAVFDNAAQGIGIADGTGRVLELNARLADMLGAKATPSPNLNVRDLKQATDPPEYWQAHEELLAGTRTHYNAEKQFTRDDGAIVWTRMRASTVRGPQGEVELLIAVFEDITEHRQMNHRLLHQATHDPLTGLPNRVRLLERLTILLSDADPGERVGVCSLDLDGFKGVNDTLGHEAGDRLLTTIARRLTQVIDPERHLVARMGGDEFVILVPHTAGSESVVQVAELVLAAVRRPIILDGHRLTVTASLGLVERTAAGTEPNELLRAADITLYWAKADGKGRWALFDQQRSAQEVDRYTLAQALPAALEHGELFLEYQPIIDLADGHALAMEALVRWDHPVRGLLGPGEFVPLAEETGAIVALGRWVLGRAVADAVTWPVGPRGVPPAVAVNLAVRQVREPGLLAQVQDALDSVGLPTDRLHLELTESAVMGPEHSGQAALETLQALAASGVRIAIDDFGTGYSNLAYLHRLPAHTLKIDSSFVAALPLADEPTHDATEAIVISLITVAHACGMTVIAEGVETPAQADRLRELGVEMAQGYHFSRPMPAHRVPTLISTGSHPTPERASNQPADQPVAADN
jgi:diguanylate cyclase (GGDEF)-like protein/PAS domain S-box-containing protein